MNRKSVLITVALVLLSGTALADTMTFDGASTGYVTGAYTESGITLLSMGSLWIIGPGGAPCGLGGCVSDGTNVGMIDVSGGLTIQVPGLFTLNGFDYGYSFRDLGGATSLQVTGFLNNIALYNTVLTLAPGAGFQYADLNWSGLDAVRLSASAGGTMNAMINANYFTVDNITVTPASGGDTQPVPEPATLTLAATGLIAFGTKFKKRILG